MESSELCDEFLGDLDRIASEGAEGLLTLTDAARETGFHCDSIGRPIRDGRPPNYGRPNAPRVHRNDVAWSFVISERARNRVSAFEHASRGAYFLEFYDRTPTTRERV